MRGRPPEPIERAIEKTGRQLPPGTEFRILFAIFSMRGENDVRRR